MVSTTAASSSIIDVLPKHRFDEAALNAYLSENLEEFEGPATVSQFQGGQSNPTFLITTANRRYVLRKKPPGKLLPSAHAVDREYKVQAALSETAVPVAPMRLYCADETVIGTPFYIMDYLEGRIFFDGLLPGIEPAGRRAIYLAMAGTLAALHAVDYKAAGLGDFGKPENYASRQVARWTQQYTAAKTGEVEVMDKLSAWLAAHADVPEEHAIAHGDFKLNNLMYAKHGPQVIALLDWELATLGHPLADLGYLCMGYRIPNTVPLLGGLGGVDLSAHNIPTEAEVVAHYCKTTGRNSVPDLTFFIALAFFRYAAIAQGVYARSLQGNAADTRAHFAGQAALALAALGWDVAGKAG
jgi:aminoglycoside phosphotransferase (APT) family kinase protein